MHPPFSVIFLTTLIGIGQGLFLAIFTGQVYSLFRLLPPQDSSGFYGIGSVLALLLLIGGGVAAAFHLGRPERAWRTVSQWRTSWLSREVILLPVFMLLVLLYGGAHLLGMTGALFYLAEGVAVDLTVLLGVAATLICFALYLATGMIYACIHFLPQWATPLTPINFVLLGGASGFTLAAAFAMFSAPELTGFFGVWAIIITLLGLFSRIATLIRNNRVQDGSSLKSAIGIRHDGIRQLHQGAMGGSFNTREFFHGSYPARLSQIRWGFLLLVFVLPIVLLLVGMGSSSTILLVAAALSQYLGLLLERWFFFADARHTQNLYYQAV